MYILNLSNFPLKEMHLKTNAKERRMEERNRWREKERKEENGKGRREGGMRGEKRGEGHACSVVPEKVVVKLMITP